jgi:hypothetical protein
MMLGNRGCYRRRERLGAGPERGTNRRSNLPATGFFRQTATKQNPVGRCGTGGVLGLGPAVPYRSLVAENDEPGDGRDLSRTPSFDEDDGGRLAWGNHEPSAASLRLMTGTSLGSVS